MSEQNKAVVRQVEEAWNANNLDSLDDLFAADFVTHAGRPGLEPGENVHQLSMGAFPDRKTTIEEMVAESDTVAVRLRMTGTNTGGPPWLGVPANNNKVDVEWISIYRLREGKVVEHRAVMDVMGLMQQLGAIPSGGAPPA
jgi:predicted ester cyclase